MKKEKGFLLLEILLVLVLSVTICYVFFMTASLIKEVNEISEGTNLVDVMDEYTYESTAIIHMIDTLEDMPKSVGAAESTLDW